VATETVVLGGDGGATGGKRSSTWRVGTTGGIVMAERKKVWMWLRKRREGER